MASYKAPLTRGHPSQKARFQDPIIANSIEMSPSPEATPLIIRLLFLCFWGGLIRGGTTVFLSPAGTPTTQLDKRPVRMTQSQGSGSHVFHSILINTYMHKYYLENETFYCTMCECTYIFLLFKIAQFHHPFINFIPPPLL